ncbi:VanZ family protein [Candidatus Spongiisocius sp.]|uniref:VanZ family protein n=1 Tax=Candidatus Spongiisocius sp. TaxID=3101273 RepID=UPI003B5AFE2F
MGSGKESAGSLFTSDRERRLWAWTAAVVVAIYSTLGLARTLAGILREEGLLVAAFGLGMLLVGGTVLVVGLRRRPGGLEIGIALGVATAYYMVLVRMALPEERTHLIEYGVVAVLFHEALKERASGNRRVPVPALIAVVAAAAVGAIDEVIQAFLPTRVFDLEDILFNSLAAVMAVASSVALSWARRWRLGRSR